MAATGVTQYYAQDFNVASLSTVGSIVVTLRADDGAVVYLNGKELARHNMPFGAPGFLTTAWSAQAGAAPLLTFALPKDALVVGTNRLAVEVHQSQANDADAYFDGDALLIATKSAPFLARGIDARHLRMFKVAAEREAGVLEQVAMPLLKQRNPEARRQAVAAVIGILLFSAIAGGIHQAGWNQGFTAGLLAGGGDGAKAVTPYLNAPYAYGPHYGGWHGFGFIGGIFRFLFFGFLIMMAFRFFAFRRWRHHNGGHDGWHNGGHGGPWQRGPWGQPQGQQPGQSQPEQSSGPSGNPAQPAENKPQNTSWINV